MKSYEDMTYHPTAEKLVQILCEKTQNPNPLFFRVLVAYYFSLVASMMRVTISTHDRGDIPINLYALNLGTSGSGKGFSTNIMENEVIHRFRQSYLDTTFPTVAEQHLAVLAQRRAARKVSDPDDELIRVTKEFEELGSLVFSFDSGTGPAVKQLRHKLLMANAGSMNLQIDEIGSNLIGNVEVLNTFLELYDKGFIKSKLIKNTADSKRNEEIVGSTPTNMLLFGTPAKLLDGAKVEEELYSMLETGYARRSFFGYSRTSNIENELTPEQVYDMLTSRASNEYLDQLSHRLELLADISYVGRKLLMTKPTSLLLIEYKLDCERIARSLPEHEAIKAAEISHRYFKVLKLAGAYAFVDDSPEVTEDHIHHAIKLAEESGAAFNGLLTRERNYVKLARYIATCRRDVTQADLVEDLPFYRGASGQKSEMLNLATAWGYKNNIIIKKSFSDGIEFLRGESLETTDLDKLILSWSTDIAFNYKNEMGKWDKLTTLTQTQGLHWVNHHLVGGSTVDANGFSQGHRNEENALPGFNMIVLDVEKSISINMARTLLAGYKYLLYTTKRHQGVDEKGNQLGDRFRIIMPINYVLKMDAKDYKEFMKNVFEWLPFEVDDQTGQRARKWLSHNGQFEYNDGEILDALPFIPKTSKNEERKARLQTQQDMNNLERWVMNNIGDGNRNNMLLRYGMILVDAGFGVDKIQDAVMALNDKIADKLEQVEIFTTIMVSVAKAIAKRP